MVSWSPPSLPLAPSLLLIVEMLGVILVLQLLLLFIVDDHLSLHCLNAGKVMFPSAPFAPIHQLSVIQVGQFIVVDRTSIQPCITATSVTGCCHAA